MAEFVPLKKQLFFQMSGVEGLMAKSELAHSNAKQTEADLLLRKLGGHSCVPPWWLGSRGDPEGSFSHHCLSTSPLQEFSPTLLLYFAIPLVFFQAAHQ